MSDKKKVKLLRITTVPISIRLLITGQPAYMKANGFDVILISSDGPDWAEMQDVNNYTIYKINMSRQIDMKNDLRSLWQLIRTLKKLRPDIVHSHTPKAGLLAMFAAAVTGVPVRIHTLAGLPLMTAGGMKRKILTVTEWLTYKFAHEVWPNSKKLYRYVLDERLLNRKKSHMILNGSSNGIDLSRFSRTALDLIQLETLRVRYAISASDFCYLAVGRMVNDKGIGELVLAFTSVQLEYPNARLFLLGPFETSDALPEEVIGQINTHERITHIAWSNEVEYFMALCQCFVHASHREGFPNVVLQAGAMGIPVVCSDIPGNADIIENDNEGYCYTVKDATALTAHMVAVLTDYPRALDKAGVLKEKVVRNYDRKAVHSAIKDRYIQLLNRKRIDVSGINKTNV